MLTSLRTAAMGVLLIHLRIEMGASVWEQFPQLQTLPEDALACFVTAQCLPEGSSQDDAAIWAEQFHRLLHVYRECRRAFHIFATEVEGISPLSDGGPGTPHRGRSSRNVLLPSAWHHTRVMAEGFLGSAFMDIRGIPK